MHSRHLAVGLAIAFVMYWYAIAAGAQVSPIIGINAPPVITNLDGDVLNYTIGQGFVVLEQNGDVTVTDTDSVNFFGGNVKAIITANYQEQHEALVVSSTGPITVTGLGVVKHSNITIGIWSWDSNSGTLVVLLNESANAARTEDLLKALKYSNGLASTLPRLVEVTIDDGDGGISLPQNVTIIFETDECVFESGFEDGETACE